VIVTGISYLQNQTTRDALSQQIRELATAARQEALDAAGKPKVATGAIAPPAIPGNQSVTVQPPPFNPAQDFPPQLESISITFFVMVAAVLIFWPITRALARRLDRGNVAPKVPAEISSQLSQLTNAVDAIALEVERISEGQRFTTRLLSDQRADQSRTILAPVASDRPPER